MVLGCDIGTALTKAVILDGDEIRHKVTVATNANPDDALNRVRAALEREAGITNSDIDQTVVTGWGQQKVSSQPPYARGAVLNQSPSCITADKAIGWPVRSATLRPANWQ